VRSALEQLLLPAECLLCRGLLPFDASDRVVCAACRTRWRSVRPPWCRRCGQPEPLFGACRLCAEWPNVLQHARAAVWLEGGARDAAHALKYGGLRRIAHDLAAVMVRILPPPDPPATLVPIPLGPRRQRERGYNQSAELALALGRHWQLPVQPGVLERSRDTATQTALTPAARVANVAGAFRLRTADWGLRIDGGIPHSAIRTPQSAIILVDDVLTTGATLAAAARALAAAGAARVSAVTFGRAAIPDFLQGA
jgi:ComF family protein